MRVVRIWARLLENEINERTNHKEYRGHCQWVLNHTTLEAGTANGMDCRQQMRNAQSLFESVGKLC